MSVDLQTRGAARALSVLTLAVLATLATVSGAVHAQVAVPSTQPAPISQSFAAAIQARAAAGASAAAPSVGAAPAVAAAAPAVAAAVPASAPPVPIMSVTGGRAPTIDAMSAAARAEHDKDAQKRLSTVFASTAPPPAPAAAATAPVVAAAAVVAAPKPDTTKTVVAIYGPVGKEVAEIRMPSGEILTVRPESRVAGYRVVAVSAEGVELAGYKGAASPARTRTPKHAVAPASARPTHAGATKRSSAAPATKTGGSKGLRLHVGDTFK